MEQLITWLTALIVFITSIVAVFAKFQTKKHCEECRKATSDRIGKVEDNVRENEKMLAEISNNVIKILEKLSTFTESFTSVRSALRDNNKDIDAMKIDINELQVIEKYKSNGSFIKD